MAPGVEHDGLVVARVGVWFDATPCPYRFITAEKSKGIALERQLPGPAGVPRRSRWYRSPMSGAAPGTISSLLREVGVEPVYRFGRDMERRRATRWTED